MLGARAELPVAEASPHALVLPFDFDWNSVEPQAQAAFGFLFEALRRRFIGPALQTNSAQEFRQLWERACVGVLDIAHAMTTLIYEATSERGGRAIVEAQLDKEDRRAADDLAERTAHTGRSDAAARLREMNVLISSARACVRVRKIEPRIRADLFELYRRGNYVWFIGISLLNEYVREWLPHHEPRTGLLDDCLSIVDEGGLCTGLATLDLCDVNCVGTEDWFGSLLAKPETVRFLLDSVRRTQSHFGPSTTVSLVHFIEPDSPGPGLTHFRIETDLEPALACDRFDAFCDEWWDAAVGFGVPIHAVLDVSR